MTRQVLVDEQLLLRLIGHTQARGEIGTAQHDAETALELCRTQPQPSSSAGEVLRLMANWLEAKHHAEGDPLVFTHWEEHRNRCRPLQIAIEALDPAHLRTLAQAQADQQARLQPEESIP